MQLSTTLPPKLPPSDVPVDVLIVAGEHSGDQHAGELVAEALIQQPDLHICAIGGVALQQAGAQLLFDLTRHAVVGLVEVLKHYTFFKAMLEETVRWITVHQPKVVCFVDYPGFNLRLAQRLFETGVAVKGGGCVKLLYYIGPQVWAWKKHRRFAMARHLDALAVIFPFEVDCFSDTTLPTTFVGHPFVMPNRSALLEYDPQGSILLLPGSRTQAVGRIFPKLLAAYQRYCSKVNNPRGAVVLYPNAEIRDALNTMTNGFPGVQLVETASGTHKAAVALTSSGTMSLEVALAAIPGAIVYVAHPFTYLVGRGLVAIKWLGIANILLNESAWPEYLQRAAKPDALAERIIECLTAYAPVEKAWADAERLRALLGEATSIHASDWMLGYLK